MPGPATPPPPPGTPPPIEGLDAEGTGPDTGGDLPAADQSAFETYNPPPPRPPTPSPVAQPLAAAQPPAKPPPDEDPTREHLSRRPDALRVDTGLPEGGALCSYGRGRVNLRATAEGLAGRQGRG